LEHCFIIKQGAPGYSVSFESGSPIGPFEAVDDVTFSKKGNNVAIYAFEGCENDQSAFSGGCKSAVFVNRQRLAGKFIDEVFFSLDGLHTAYVASDKCLVWGKGGDAGVPEQRCNALGDSRLIVDGKELAHSEGIDSPVFSNDGHHFAYSLLKATHLAKGCMGCTPYKVADQMMNRIDGRDNGWFIDVSPVVFSPDSRNWAYFALVQCEQDPDYYKNRVCISSRRKLVTNLGDIPLYDDDSPGDFYGSRIAFSSDSKRLNMYKGPSFLLDSAVVPMSFEGHYEGRIGASIPLHVALHRSGNNLSGFDSYDKYPGQVPLKGTVDSEGHIALFELDSFGRHIGVFNGDFLRYPDIAGVWSKPDGTKSKIFRLISTESPNTGLTTGFLLSRIDPTLAQLPNGNLLLLGGKSSSVGRTLSSVELFDSQKKEWKIKSPLPVPIANSDRDPTFAVLDDGRLFAICTYSDNPCNPQIYDPAKDRWQDGKPLEKEMYVQSILALENAKVLLALDSGGGSGNSDEIWIYDAKSDKWTKGATVPEQTLISFGVYREYSMVKLKNGKVLFVGASKKSLQPYAQLYDPNNDEWEALPANDTDEYLPDLALLDDGRVLALGRNNAELYDPASNRWESITVTDKQRVGSGSIFMLKNGKYLIINTYYPANGFLFDPKSNSIVPQNLNAPKGTKCSAVAPIGSDQFLCIGSGKPIILSLQ